MIDDHARVREVMISWATRPGRGVIFDFNGTLSDDEDLLQLIFTELFERHLGWRMPVETYQSQLLGRSDREIVEFAVRNHGSADEAQVELLLGLRSRHYRTAVAQRSPITSATSRLVRRLHEAAVPMAIVTGAQRADVLAVLDRSMIDGMVKVLVTAEDVSAGKPDPEGFLQAAARMGLRPMDLLVFEDSVPGAIAALCAGMRCIGVLGARPESKIAPFVDAATKELGPGLLDHVAL